jgi:hypothetical protein
MKIDMYPVQIEARDGYQLIYTLKCFDECCAELSIGTVVCVESWPDIAQSIQSALELMYPERINATE